MKPFHHSTDFHFTNYSFSFLKVQILQITDQCSSLFFQVGGHVRGHPDHLQFFFVLYLTKHSA